MSIRGKFAGIVLSLRQRWRERHKAASAATLPPSVATARGNPDPENPRGAPAPTNRKLPDGQYEDHWVMPEEERREKGYVRPVRTSYRHVGTPGPKYPTRDLTADEKQRHGGSSAEYAKYEEYPEGAPERGPGSIALGRFWTQAQLDSVGQGCGAVTKMPAGCAETYARSPSFYGSTFCCGCNEYLPVGHDGEFVWEDDGTRVGT